MLERQTARSSSTTSTASSSSTSSRTAAPGPTAAPMLDAPEASESDLWGQSAARTAAATTSASGLGTATLQQGSRGPAVVALQNALNRYGATLQPDGSFGPVTHRAVVAFQRANALKPDGIVGSVTRGVLTSGRAKSVGAAPAAPSTAPATPSTAPSGAGGGLGTATLQLGARGATVEALQRLLNTYGAAIRVDGDFGNVTHRAVVAFQTANSLKPDGVVGSVTRGVLLGGSAKSVTAAPAASAPGSAGGAPGSISSALGWARTQVGAPYFGGASPFRDGSRPGNGQSYQMEGQSRYVSTAGVIGYDCSGFVTAVMRQAGINLGATSSSALKRSLPEVSKSSLQPGDLLVKDGHVAIYLGGGQMIESIPRGVSIGSAAKYISDASFVGRRPW